MPNFSPKKKSIEESDDNNNNIAFCPKQQKGHKPKRGHGSGTLIANLQALRKISFLG
jgi:hypothetical protein